jgi:hypothetical protein
MPRPYCIRPCIAPACAAFTLRSGRAPRPSCVPRARPSCQTPRGGSNRRPGGAENIGAPLHARESKNLGPKTPHFSPDLDPLRPVKGVDQKAADPQRIKDPGGLGEAYLQGVRREPTREQLLEALRRVEAVFAPLPSNRPRKLAPGETLT